MGCVILEMGTGNLNVTCDTVEIQLLAENPTTSNKLFSSYQLPRRADGVDTWIRWVSVRF